MVPPRQIGIAGKQHHESLLKALSLFLVSDFATYYQFFTSPDWGVKRELATIRFRSLKEIPIPFVGMREADLAPWVELHSHAVREWKVQRTLFDDGDEAPGMSPSAIDSKLNLLTYSAPGSRCQEICLVADLARVRIELDEGKLSQVAAVQPPKEPELFFYAGAGGRAGRLPRQSRPDACSENPARRRFGHGRDQDRSPDRKINSSYPSNPPIGSRPNPYRS